MVRLSHCLRIIIIFFLLPGYSGAAYCNTVTWNTTISGRDTIPESQVLYNGRIWRNRYYNIKGDPYLLSNDFITGSVTMNGQAFERVKILYDIYDDEILTLTNRNIIIQLNKEMVDKFTINFPGVNSYYFRRITNEKKGGPEGFVNILYEGMVSLWIKYLKLVEPRAIDNKYDSFYQVHKIYVNVDTITAQTRNKKQLIQLFEDRKQEVKDYIRKNKIKISGRQPESFIPVVEFYDRLKRQN